MVTRIINASNSNKQQEDLNKLRDILIKSKYPKYLIENSIQTCLKQNNNNTTVTMTTNQSVKNRNDDMKFNLSLPYVTKM
jgi:hypothetical protein